MVRASHRSGPTSSVSGRVKLIGNRARHRPYGNLECREHFAWRSHRIDGAAHRRVEERRRQASVDHAHPVVMGPRGGRAEDDPSVVGFEDLEVEQFDHA